MKHTQPKPPPITASGIARLLGRSPKGVANAIARLGLTPLFETVSGNYYDPAIIPALKEGMRQPNRTR
jgi:hypothetical protein